ncbi:ATP-binding protein [Massilia sp. W12]|uniref:ATP-binding protein n=1 Tax=Massilia sp. W12 TaxID=3126507 RepID=UPI0030CEBE2B
MMQIFIHNDALQALLDDLQARAILQQLQGAQGSLELNEEQIANALPELVELAWHLRQRNTSSAWALAQQVKDWLPALPHPQQDSLHARLLLVRGEAKWLLAELELAQQLAQRALLEFTRLQDHEGCADAHWLLAWIANDRGDYLQHDEEMVKVQAAAQLAQDPLRASLAQAGQAISEAFRDPQTAMRRWQAHLPPDEASVAPALMACWNDFQGRVASQTSDFAQAIACRLRTREAALQTGQIGRAIYAMVNVGSDFSCLNEHTTALEWAQKGLDLARATGWPSRIGGCLIQSAETLRLLGRLDAAQELLDEALTTMAPLRGSRTWAQALRSQGELALDKGDYEAALDWFGQLQERAQALAQNEFEIIALRGQANAWLRLNKAQPAISAALLSLAQARQHGDALKQIEALQVLAEIHARQPGLPNEAISAGSASLHYLRQALEIAGQIEGYTVPGPLLDAVAQAHAAAGDFESAFAVVRQANAAREKINSQQATNRAIAMQVRYETERAQAEGDYHRQLAQSEARRAQVLQQTSTTLAHLSAIGQEITAHLDTDAVYGALNRHLHGLLDVNYFAVYLADPDGLGLTSHVRIQDGQTLGSHHVLASHPHSYSLRALREQCEFVVNVAPEDEQKSLTPDAIPTLSMLFGPLIVDGRVLGAMTVQSRARHAYGEREQLIFRTLCAYGAIALDNARTYQQLQQAQQQLVAQEKLAELGALVAGVAHELNSPIGNSLMIASSLQEQTGEMRQAMQNQALHFNHLQQFLQDTREASRLILRGLENAADLVNSFKQVAVDRTSAQRRVFDLQQTCHEIVATMMSQIRPSGHSITLDIPEKIRMHSYPGPLGQVLTNLINNALTHGFENGMPGQMRLCASLPASGRVLLQFSDNGKGIPQENLNRIFDPFFTTRLGAGGSGLGLNICANIVTSLLKGSLKVRSTPGAGATFTLDLPLVVEDELLQSLAQEHGF